MRNSNLFCTHFAARRLFAPNLCCNPGLHQCRITKLTPTHAAAASGEPADRRPAAETRAGRLPTSDPTGDRGKTPEGARAAARGEHPSGAPAGVSAGGVDSARRPIRAVGQRSAGTGGMEVGGVLPSALRPRGSQREGWSREGAPDRSACPVVERNASRRSAPRAAGDCTDALGCACMARRSCKRCDEGEYPAHLR